MCAVVPWLVVLPPFFRCPCAPLLPSAWGRCAVRAVEPWLVAVLPPPACSPRPCASPALLVRFPPSLAYSLSPGLLVARFFTPSSIPCWSALRPGAHFSLPLLCPCAWLGFLLCLLSPSLGPLPSLSCVATASHFLSSTPSRSCETGVAGHGPLRLWSGATYVRLILRATCYGRTAVRSFVVMTMRATAMQSFMAVTVRRRHPTPLACKERARGQRVLALLLVRQLGAAVASFGVRRAFPVADMGVLVFRLYGNDEWNILLCSVCVSVSIPGAVCSGLCLPWRMLFVSSFDGAPCREEAARGGVGQHDCSTPSVTQPTLFL